MCVMKEEYRRYNETYEVSDLGNVKKDGVVLNKLPKDEYYYYVVSNGKPVRVHNMVGECFPEICGEKILFGHYHHLNHNQLDNRAENIRCISASEHRKLHQIEDGVSVSVKAYDKNGKFVGRWDSMLQAAQATGQGDHRHIRAIIKGTSRRFTAAKLFWFKADTPEEEVQKKILEIQNAKYQSLRKNSEKKCA